MQSDIFKIFIPTLIPLGVYKAFLMSYGGGEIVFSSQHSNRTFRLVGAVIFIRLLYIYN